MSINPLVFQQSHIKYFIFNNSGFCYNILKDFNQGEKFCRRAIKLESGLSNEYKNLGISLEGQNRFLEAVETYLEATSKNASDKRAMDLLMGLILRHPEIRAEIQDLDQKIENCLHKMPSAIYFSSLLRTK